MSQARPASRPGLLLMALGAVAAVAPFAAPAQAAMFLPLLPGTVIGGMHAVSPQRYESAAYIAVRYGVHSSHVNRSGYGGLKVDSRRVVPRFYPQVNGIVLNVPECQVYLVRDGEIERDYPVAVSAPDKPTRIGLTQVVSKQANPTWFVPKSIQKEMAQRGQKVRTEVKPGPSNPLGPRWLGFWDGTFGMHGTLVPTSIKRYASHGCVRFRTGDIKDLFNRVGIGTPVRVVYQPVMMGLDTDTIWVTVYPDIYKHGFNYRNAVKTLAAQAGVQDQLNWPAVERAIARHDGILTNVGQGQGLVNGGGYMDGDVGPDGYPVQTQVVRQKPKPKPTEIPEFVPPDPGLTPADMEGLNPDWLGGQTPPPYFSNPY